MRRSGPLHPGGHTFEGSAQEHRPAAATQGVRIVKKFLTWLAIAFVIFYVIQAPEQSAAFVRTAGNAIGDAASSLADFFQSLA
jgi:hypothetical protein